MQGRHCLARPPTTPTTTSHSETLSHRADPQWHTHQPQPPPAAACPMCSSPPITSQPTNPLTTLHPMQLSSRQRPSQHTHHKSRCGLEAALRSSAHNRIACGAQLRTTSNNAQPARRPRPDMTPTNTHTHPPRPPRVSATPHHARSPQPRTHPPEYPHNHQYTPNSKPRGPLSDPDRASRAQSRTPPDPLRSMCARWLTFLRLPKVRCSTKIRSHNHDVTSRHMDTRTACWLTQGCRKAAAPAPLLPLRHAS